MINQSTTGIALVLFYLFNSGYADAEEVDFNRDIRPILSDKCFFCHGPDAKNQKSDFRLDTGENSRKDLGGYFGIVPGNLKESETHWRIRAANSDDDVMPPVDSNRSLTNREKDLLDAWIEQGAEYDLHWSFQIPKRPELPELNEVNRARARNPIDHFILARLEAEKLEPSAEADQETLFRRASLALTGLLPKPESVAAAKDYEAFVDSLLNSTDYAERQTLRWLDGARYADTDGYQNDAERKNWPWRDWVIQSFEENMPFDQFTIEQLAGDMLPKATSQQVLASAFNRNHRQNSEGGALAEEFFVENVIDRVETTSTVWLGLTMGCARCHDHKYDPLTQREFYQLFAYFNNIGEAGRGQGVKANPILKARSPLTSPPGDLLAKRKAAEKSVAEAESGMKKRLDAWIAAKIAAREGKAEGWFPAEVTSAKVDKGGKLTREPDGSWLFSGQNVKTATYNIHVKTGEQKITGLRLDALPNGTFGKPRKLARSVNGNFVLTGIEISIIEKSKPPRPVKISRVAASVEQSGYPIGNTIDNKAGTGWAVFAKGSKAEAASAFLVFKKPLKLKAGESLNVKLLHQSKFADHNIGQFKLFLTDNTTPDIGTSLSRPVLAALKTPAKRRSKGELKTLRDYYRSIDEPLKDAEKKLQAVTREMEQKGFGEMPVMVMREREGERKPAFLLDRGQYQNPVTKDPLPRAVPAALFNGRPEEQPRDRLELARWLVSQKNPLTARVMVNRVWQDHFGIGLVKTVEDFGAQGENPSHPKLLDWLAVEFMESGWDMKALHRLIVTSATFRQGSMVDPTLLDRDPDNRLIARGPRYRLDGFTIRDMALDAAGLLDKRIGGPPVKPYQPVGLWNAVSSGAGTRYSPAKGADLYRKSLYTYWKRAVNPPRQIIFDAGGRETCNVRVRRTNTPLQALVLMNDETFIEAARNIAQDALEKSKSPAGMYRQITAKKARPETLAVLNENLKFFKKHFAAHESEAAEFLKTGSSPSDEKLPVSELAAWTAVAHLILNLDETITLE